MNRLMMMWVALLLLAGPILADDFPSVDRKDSCKNKLGGKEVTTPLLTHAALTEDWNALDANAEAMMQAAFKNDHTFVLFPHARDVFKHHLIGTFSILGQWGQPEDIKRMGLFHTGYSGDLFQFARWDARAQKDRDVLRNIVGDTAENLTWRFGTMNRGAIANLSLVMRDDVDPTPLVAGSILEVPHRLQGSMQLTAEDAGKVLMVTLADYLEQMVAVNGWRDHHQIEESTKLYPGILARPELAFYWITKMCRAIRGVVETVPAAFDGCQRVISRQDETSARDSYWAAVSAEEGSSDQQELLEIACGLNPFVGEPHFLLSQLAYRRGDFCQSREEAKSALKKMYALGAAWDKRLSYQAWVAHARMMLVRSNRRIQGLSSLPSSSDQPPTSGGLPIVMLDDLVKEFTKSERDNMEDGAVNQHSID